MVRSFTLPGTIRVRRSLLASGVGVALPVAAITLAPDPAEPDVGTGPCTTVWKLMTIFQDPYHSFGEQEGFAAQPDTVRDLQ